jgi:hypothetical protein
MSLTLRIGGAPEAVPGNRAFSPLLCFDCKIAGLAATLVDEIFTEIEISPVSCCPVELDKGQLDLLVPGISSLLPLFPPENSAYVISESAHQV